MSSKPLELRFFEVFQKAQKRQGGKLSRKINLINRALALAKRLDEKNENSNSVSLVRGTFSDILG